MSDYTHIINGKPVTSDKKLAVINPATQKKIAEVPVATRDQLDEAVVAARAALPAWSSKTADERAEVLNHIIGVIEKNLEDYKQILTSEQGKPLSGSHIEIALSAIPFMREVAKIRVPDKVLRDDDKQKIVETRVPIGVCAGIVPWNFPLLLCTIKLGPALLAGNTLIIKPSPFTPLTTLRFIKDIQHLVPPGVVNVLSGDDDLGPMITSHPGIDKISFTGSSDTGKKVMQSASKSLKRLTLELGGNDAAIILPDVKIDEVAPHIFWTAFANTSQGCTAAKRIFIHESIYDQFRDALVEYAKTIKVGNGAEPDTQLGPLQNITQYKKVLTFFEDAHHNNFNFVLGGDINPNPTNGLFVPISIVDNPPEDSKLVQEEPFGPIVPLLKWSDEADVIKRANNTRMGLSASVWSQNLEVAQRIAKQMQSGTVCINERLPFTPISSFGGHKESGIGLENGLHGLLSYSNLQTFIIKK